MTWRLTEPDAAEARNTDFVDTMFDVPGDTDPAAFGCYLDMRAAG